MDFSYMGSGGFGTDQITSSTPMNYNMSDIFMTQSKIDEYVRRPIPMPDILPPEPQPVPVGNKKKEAFTVDDFPVITENMLIILLLVILVILCTMIYSTLKQTCEALKIISMMSTRK